MQVWDELGSPSMALFDGFMDLHGFGGTYHAHARAAVDFAQRLFDHRNTTGELLEGHIWAVSPYKIQRDESGNLVIVEHVVQFSVMDETGRIADVAMVLETKELLAIQTSWNDLIPHNENFNLPEEGDYEPDMTPPSDLSLMYLDIIHGPHPTFAEVAPQHAQSAEAMSYTEAAHIGTMYIWDMFRARIDRHTVHMVYMDWPSGTRSHWYGQVFAPDPEEELFRYNPAFTFLIDAVTGERIDIQGPARFWWAGFGEGEAITSADLPFAELARTYAARHFQHTTVTEVQTYLWDSFDFDAEDGIPASVTYRVAVFHVTDSTGRMAIVSICMTGGHLDSISTQHNDRISDMAEEWAGLGVG